MKTYPIAMCLVCCVLLVTGCATAPRAPLTDAGEKIEIMVLSDRGNPSEMTELQYQHHVKVGQWMERDLLNVLRRLGYEAVLIESKDEFEARKGRYLLTVKIESYNPGGAARMLVRFSEGAASLDNRYSPLWHGLMVWNPPSTGKSYPGN